MISWMSDEPIKRVRKRGRKTEMLPCEVLERANLSLDAMTLRKLKVMGDGNASKGARYAARIAYERFLNTKR
jgi:hypothetical protein